MTKKGRLKKYRQKVKQYWQNRTFQKAEKNSINNWEAMTQKHTNNQTPKKSNNFGRKYGNLKSISKRLNGENDITRELEGLGEFPIAEIHFELLKKH